MNGDTGPTFGYSNVYRDTISWATPTTPLPMEINPRVVEKLDPNVRATMAKNISADLIKIPKDQILSHF